MFDDYIHDMKLTQRFAVLNRKAMADIIVSGMGFTITDEFTTIHNYIDTDAMILRKGSVSAKAGEKLLIPINMRDGSLICIGKGNEEWNCSAPHGAGKTDEPASCAQYVVYGNLPVGNGRHLYDLCGAGYVGRISHGV